MRRARRVLSVAVGLVFVAAGASPVIAAAAEAPKPGWEAISNAYPTDLAPGGKGIVQVEPLNVGAADSEGEVTVVDTLPEGVTATDAGEAKTDALDLKPELGHEYWHCAIAAGAEANSIVTCHNDPVRLPVITGGAGTATFISEVELQGSPYQGHQPQILIAVEIAGTAPSGAEASEIEVSGGGAASPINVTAPLTIGSSTPPFGFSRWGGWFSNADGSLDTTAGSVPYSATFSFDLNKVPLERVGGSAFLSAPGQNVGEPRDFVAALPPGVVGNPNAVPQCTRRQLNGSVCPPASMVGFAIIPAQLNFAFAVHDMAAPPGTPAEFGFTFEGTDTFLDAKLRTGSDYGIDTVSNNSAQKEILGVTVTLWGVPHDPSHNVWREIGLVQRSCTKINLEPGSPCNLGPHPALKPFLRLPTSCSAPQPFSIWANTWSDPETTAEAGFLSPGPGGGPSGFTECNKLPFAPTIAAKPTTDVADAPSGLHFDLHIPQPEAVHPEEGEAKYPFEAQVPGETRTIGAEPEPHEADLKQAVVTLPKGISVNPASANGLGACSAAQIGLTSAPGAPTAEYTEAPATCPDAAKIGSVTVETPLLTEHDEETGEPTIPHPLQGAVYVAKPSENPFGSLLAIYIAVDDPQTGTVIKLAGQVKPDPQSGRLETVFSNNPQLPFEDFHLDFFGGAGAALRTPATCGTYQIATDMTPWSTPEGADAAPGDSFEIAQSPSGGACPATEAAEPNAPAFSAGTIQPKAGAYSPFVLHLKREDGSQELKAIDTTLPQGLIGKLAGISECSAAQVAQARSREHVGGGAEELADPSCPASSEVGTLTVGAGAGPDPYYVTGHAYLGGPYKGAPLSLVTITPGIAGPYDLGTVVDDNALQVNPETAQITAVTDDIPHILDGIPLDIRSVSLKLDRPNFTLNPTNCEKKSILGSATSLLGQSAPISDHFQVGECSKLGFAPKLAISLKGPTKRAGHPALKAVVTYPTKGAYSNIAFARVNLPHSEFLDQGHLNNICTKVQFAEGSQLGEKCPPSSIYGFAKATTPLLEAPVEGPVYLRSPLPGHKLPDLVAALNGQISVALVGKIDTGPNHGIRNTFEVVPDAPVTRFELTMQGGGKGLLENSENICAKPQKAIVDFIAQNGKVDDYNPLIANSCKVKHKKGHHKKRHRGRR